MENQKHAASGYRFDPSEQQILQYLLTKVTEKPLPSGLPFMEQDLYAAHPRDLFRSLPPEEKIVYCFTNLNRRGAKRFERTVRTGSNTVGSWKTQQSSNIYDAEGHGLIGVKKLLTFQGNDTSTGFSIREYHLAGKFSQVNTNYVACRIERKIKRGGLETHQPLRAEGQMGVSGLDPATQLGLQEIEKVLMRDDSEQDAVTSQFSDEHLKTVWLDQA